MEDFREIFERTYDSLVLYATQIIHDVDSARDVVQDCFIDFIEKKRYQKLINNEIDKYIFTSVRHKSLKYIREIQRRQKRHQIVASKIEDDKNYFNPDLGWESLLKAINQLPEERRKIFMMVILDGKKYQEVSDILKLSINTVKTQMGRAFKHLRNVLDPEDFISLLIFLKKNRISLSP